MSEGCASVLLYCNAIASLLQGSYLGVLKISKSGFILKIKTWQDYLNHLFFMECVGRLGNLLSGNIRTGL